MYRLSPVLIIFCVATLHAGPTLSQRFERAHTSFARLAQHVDELPTTFASNDNAVHRRLAACQENMLTIQGKVAEGDLPANLHTALNAFLHQLRHLSPEALLGYKQHNARFAQDDIREAFGTLLHAALANRSVHNGLDAPTMEALRDVYETAHTLLTPECYERDSWWREAAATTRMKVAHNPGKSAAAAAAVALTIAIGIAGVRHSYKVTNAHQAGAIGSFGLLAEELATCCNNPAAFEASPYKDLFIVPTCFDGIPEILHVAESIGKTGIPSYLTHGSFGGLAARQQLWQDHLTELGLADTVLLLPEECDNDLLRIMINISRLQDAVILSGRMSPADYDLNTLPAGKTEADLVISEPTTPSAVSPPFASRKRAGSATTDADGSSVGTGSARTTPASRRRDLLLHQPVYRAKLAPPPAPPKQQSPWAVIRAAAALRRLTGL